MAKVGMSEARLNDFIYTILKYLYFQPAFGEGRGPRECDIRMCMDMTCKERIKSQDQAILSDTEISPRSHGVFHNVDLDIAFDECKTYMEDHWFKDKVENLSGNKNWLVDAKKMVNESILPEIMKVPEDDCGGPTKT